MKATVVDAINFAKEKHKGQVDDEGKDYFQAHCLQVAEIIELVAPGDEELIQAAVLHDTLEDTDTTMVELAETFGNRVSGLVLEVTHEGKKDNEGYYFPRLKTKEGIILKFADRISNLSRMGAWPKKRQMDYLRKSKFWKTTPGSISNMEDFQRKYLPGEVGKSCPYCGCTKREIEETEARRGGYKRVKKDG